MLGLLSSPPSSPNAMGSLGSPLPASASAFLDNTTKSEDSGTPSGDITKEIAAPTLPSSQSLLDSGSKDKVSTIECPTTIAKAVTETVGEDAILDAGWDNIGQLVLLHIASQMIYMPGDDEVFEVDGFGTIFRPASPPKFDAERERARYFEEHKERIAAVEKKEREDEGVKAKNKQEELERVAKEKQMLKEKILGRKRPYVEDTAEERMPKRVKATSKEELAVAKETPDEMKKTKEVKAPLMGASAKWALRKKEAEERCKIAAMNKSKRDIEEKRIWEEQKKKQAEIQKKWEDEQIEKVESEFAAIKNAEKNAAKKAEKKTRKEASVEKAKVGPQKAQKATLRQTRRTPAKEGAAKQNARPQPQTQRPQTHQQQQQQQRPQQRHTQGYPQPSYSQYPPAIARVIPRPTQTHASIPAAQSLHSAPIPQHYQTGPNGQIPQFQSPHNGPHPRQYQGQYQVQIPAAQTPYSIPHQQYQWQSEAQMPPYQPPLPPQQYQQPPQPQIPMGQSFYHGLPSPQYLPPPQSQMPLGGRPLVGSRYGNNVQGTDITLPQYNHPYESQQKQACPDVQTYAQPNHRGGNGGHQNGYQSPYGPKNSTSYL
ncbi:hypothetical protein P154DRAFT_531286 [Amniculicola lignicola CBS 123094]|uniref:Uncharacterized protein n=1 Tax=Amniculicola lignicola CBS 123094 TaxID=1392246 RepID=A0A6A5WUE6_9PLEO|nr:hypothetical protein P154DRAFT_531286 [Amniculicola lignicola CBS 123094]